MKWLSAIKSVGKIVLAAAGVFAPIKHAAITVLVLVLSDLVLGLLDARKSGQPLTCKGLRTTIGKLLAYEILMRLSFLTQQYLVEDLFPLVNIVNAFIGLIEISSIINHLNNLSGSSMLGQLIQKVNPTTVLNIPTTPVAPTTPTEPTTPTQGN